ncbi:MAG: hypothetical protein ACYTEX_26890, partial [Planctomycetota bacterium]
PSPPEWSGAASGAGVFKWVTFSSEGSKEVTAKCCSTCGDGKTVNIEVVEPSVCEVGFYGDYVLFETPVEWEGWADGVNEIPVPQYDCNTGDDFEICVPMGSSNVGLWKVKLRVDEAITYTTAIKVDAGGTELWDESNDVSFPQASVLSEEALLEITGSIVDEVKVYDNDFQIDWKYKVPSPGGTNSYYTINTTDHNVYVVYDDPNYGDDGEFTVQRIDKLCTWADGNDTRKEIADSIHSSLSLPFGSTNQSDYWDLMCGSCSAEGQCDEHARFMVRCLDMIGTLGSEWYNTYASNDVNVLEADSKIVDSNLYYLKFDADGNHEVDNHFEGSVKVPTNDAMTQFHFYTVSPKLDANSPCLLWRQIGPDNKDWKQVWVHSPSGEWIDAWIGEDTLAGFEGYDSCP